MEVNQGTYLVSQKVVAKEGALWASAPRTTCALFTGESWSWVADPVGQRRRSSVNLPALLAPPPPHSVPVSVHVCAHCVHTNVYVKLPVSTGLYFYQNQVIADRELTESLCAVCAD